MRLHILLLAALLPALNACTGGGQSSTAAVGQNDTGGTEIDCVQLPGGMADVEVRYDKLRIHFNPKLRIPSVVAYRLTADDVAKSDSPNAAQRSDYNFNADPNVENCPEWYEYKNSGYTRGHMAPAMDMKGNRRQMEQCFRMTNIVPQVKQLNEGEWREMEEAVHRLAKNRKEIYVVTGTAVTNDGFDRIGPKHDIAVPQQLFKLVYVPSMEKGVAFLFDNTGTGISWRRHAVSIRSIEQLTGMDFFPTLTQQQQDSIETSSDMSWWTGSGRQRGNAKR